MPSLMDQLHDIEGIDAISSWPLASGWWVVIIVGIFVLGLLIWLCQRRWSYLNSWKRDVLRQLDHLEKNLTPSHSGETVVFLSEYLRRIALHRFPRKECAGLIDEAWLKWLKDHDSHSFDWTEKGKVLTELPYARVPRELPVQTVKELIQAVRYWVS